MTRRALLSVLSICMIIWASAPASGADWPTYRGDVARSGASTDRIKAPLSLEWVFTPTAKPEHAWGDPQPKPIEGNLELPRMRFDDAFQVAADRKGVYFGSSADNKVYALDAKTGQVKWQFTTDGPVRLAPTLAGGKVYAGSDDGNVYCLRASDGRLEWTFSAAPAKQKVLGNGKMISLWPVRTGVLVDGGVAYFAAGVFPAEGLYLYAVSARSGKLIWKNDTYGRGGAGTVSPQGYLLASDEKIFVPSSRSMPAGFDRKTGRFLFHKNFSWRQIGLFGGTYNLLAGKLLLNGTEQLLGVRQRDGQLAFTEALAANDPSKGSRRVTTDGKSIYLLTGTHLVAAEQAAWFDMRKRTSGPISNLRRERDKLRRQARDNPRLAKRYAAFKKRLVEALLDQREQEAKISKWRIPCRFSGSMALSRGIVFAGGNGVVKGFDTATGQEVFSGKVDGAARGLAIASSKLLVSTDTGGIYCFVQGTKGKGTKVAPTITANPFGAAGADGAKLARKILARSGVKRGYALILGGDGTVALELARRTELMSYVVQPDAKKAAAARKALSAAGVYGTKAAVMHMPLDAPPFADYFANLIVCREPGTPAAELLRMLKPCGGVACIPGGADEWAGKLRRTVADAGETATQVAVSDGLVTMTRGALPGAGSWTHEYAEPGNTACGDDKRVRGPIGTLWFGRPGPERMPSRHASNAAPLAFGGRMFIQGENVIMAYDAYNGLKLWERDIPGASRLGLKYGVSNFAADGKSLFVVISDKCLRLDAVTGRTLRTYKIPAKGSDPRSWGYVATTGGTLYGSAAKRVFERGGAERIYAINWADQLFALDVETGKLQWKRDVEKIWLNTVCLGGGRLYYIDRTVTAAQQAQAVKGITHQPKFDRRGKPVG
ncbi:hypothetical protein LCGC14_1744910, partial [marine sediment metagenome]